MKWKRWSFLLGVFLLLMPGLTACDISLSTGSNQDPAIPHLTRQDRGWIDPTARVKAATLEALRHEADIFEAEGFQPTGVFFSDVVSGPSKIAADFGNENKIGSAGKDNGLVILVLLDRAGADGTKPYIFVAPGKGLEGLLNDARVTRFREAFFNPLRAQGQWEQGLIQLCSRFAAYLSNPDAQAFSDASLGQATQAQPAMPFWVMVMLFLFVFAVIVGSSILTIVRHRRFGGSHGSGPWDSGSSGGGSYGGGGSFGGGGSGG